MERLCKTSKGPKEIYGKSVTIYGNLCLWESTGKLQFEVKSMETLWGFCGCLYKSRGVYVEVEIHGNPWGVCEQISGSHGTYIENLRTSFNSSNLQVPRPPGRPSAHPPVLFPSIPSFLPYILPGPFRSTSNLCELQFLDASTCLGGIREALTILVVREAGCNDPASLKSIP